MTHGSLFSGIGGFDLAADWMGWDNKFHCEWNEFGQKILKYYWPNATSYGDITKTDFTIWRGKIDVLTGGFPCQPYSTAGKRLGKEDDRHLWPEMLRAIREIKPRWVIGENVYGLVNWSGGLVFNEVQVELENEGYEVQPYILPACGVGAIHRRERVWFVARNTKLHGCTSPEIGRTDNESQVQTGENKVWKPTGTDSIQSASEYDTNSDNQGSQRSEEYGGFGEIWENGNKQSPRRIPQIIGNISTEPGIRRGDYGIPYRVDRLKALGNAIVPQVALQLFKTIEQFEKTLK